MQVLLHGGRGHNQLPCYLIVGHARRDETQHRSFPRRERRQQPLARLAGDRLSSLRVDRSFLTQESDDGLPDCFRVSRETGKGRAFEEEEPRARDACRESAPRFDRWGADTPTVQHKRLNPQSIENRSNVNRLQRRERYARGLRREAVSHQGG